MNRIINVLRREANIVQRDTSTGERHLILQDGDWVKGEHGLAGAVCGDFSSALSVAGGIQGAFAVAHHLCSVEVVDSELLGGGLDNAVYEAAGGIVDKGDSSVGDVEGAISNVCGVKLAMRVLVERL